MFFSSIKDFPLDMELWQQVIAGVLVVTIAAIAAFVRRMTGPETEKNPTPSGDVTTTTVESPTQSATGEGITQSITIDKSQHESVRFNVQSGATMNVTLINYADGLPQAENHVVKSLFAKGRMHYAKKEFMEAINEFKRCLAIEKDHEELGALNLQIGNSYYGLRFYLKAAEYYAAGLREARKANDRVGEASNHLNLGTTYVFRPASNGVIRGENIHKAVEHYQNALQIFIKDEYPVEYATTQNNLGTAYTALPAASPEERAENVRKAVNCYLAALAIYKKDEYPQSYCYTAANLGSLLASINDPEACHWFKEAYALRVFLPDQGAQFEKLMHEICKEK
jgi:tetratricopeptide (TPR) repeat protein